VKAALRDRLGLRVRLVRVEDMPDTLREYDEPSREVLLSEALDHPNRVFQLVHVAGLIENRALFDDILESSNISDAHGLARCRVELANYFAAAVLMPYGPYLAEALASKYDFDHLATRFGVSFEQACHRATTLQRSGAQGVPFFFLRIDKAGNVTKRFNATDFHLAEYGGACPRLDVHTSFRVPGGSCRNSSRCRTPASSSSSPAPWTALASRGTRRTCAWPWPWAARWSISTGSAMPRISPPAPPIPRRSASTAASARA
jgi:predicted transcriptional regulator